MMMEVWVERNTVLVIIDLKFQVYRKPTRFLRISLSSMTNVSHTACVSDVYSIDLNLS